MKKTETKKDLIRWLALSVIGGWLPLFVAFALSAPSVIGADTAYREHISQKERYLHSLDDFENDRRARIVNQSERRFCALEVLTPNEQRVAGVLSNHVAAFFSSNRTNLRFGPMRPFYEVKGEIARTEAYQMLTNMPKGALLHAHLMAIGRMDWVISNALTLPNCYVKWPADSTARDRGHLLFLTPEQAAATSEYFLVSQKVAQFPPHGPGSFSNVLRSTLLFDEDDGGPEKRPWDQFDKLRGLTGDFIRDRSVFTNYLLDAFLTLWNDGVYYVELRDSLGSLTSLNQPPGSREDYITQFSRVRDTMQARYPQFDCRLILAGYRGIGADDIVQKMRQALDLRGSTSNLFVGFDLVGEESGKTDVTTHAKVADVQRKIATDAQCRDLIIKLGTNDLPYFLHDGESVWADNQNLIDAVMLATPRIGHGFNLYLFPFLYDEIKTKNIALEVCPISNQLLGLSPDLRTHPAAGYMNDGIQCTLSSDDPLFFGNDGLSYDFWEALIAWNLDLQALKKLARNSITFSGLDSAAKSRLMTYWETEWNKFIQKANAKAPAGK